MRGISLRQYGFMMRLLSPLLRAFVYIRYLRGKEEAGRLSERFGSSYRQSRPDGRIIWIHAVSVGEAVAARLLAKQIRAQKKDCTILITTNTHSSAQQLARLASTDNSYIHAYQPLDVKGWVQNFLSYWQPDMAIFVESDFWPHLVCCTRDRGVDIYFASSQLSASAFARWRDQPMLAHTLFSAPKQIFCIDAEQKTQFEALASGFGNAEHTTRISLSNTLKLPPQQLETDLALTAGLAEAASGRMVILASSTHEGEEVLIHSACKTLLDEKKALLIIAPRHPERGRQISATFGQPPYRSKQQMPAAGDDIFICDSMGEMDSLYAVSDVIILGASFVDRGGHNPLEAARASVPILTGRFNDKNRAEIEALSATDMLTQLDDMAALTQALEHLHKCFETHTAVLTDTALKAAKTALDARYLEAEKIASKMLKSLT